MVEKYPSKIEAPKEASAFDSGVKIQPKPIGSSGTEVYGGYFSEEYLQQLRGRRGAKIWDEMRRSEPQISMLLGAIGNPIKAANWHIEDAEDVPDAETHSKLIEACLFEMIDWEAFLHEALGTLPFGFSLFEPIHNVITNHPILGTINGLKALAWRSQKTIESWEIEKQTGKLLAVNQFVYSDIGDNVKIPGEFLLVFTINKEGDNYEGISILRSMYGSWFRKNLYLKLIAIGLEKYAVGTPIGTVPAGKEKDEDIEGFKNILSNYTSHESAYLLKPFGFEIEIQKTDFDADKVKEIVLLENTEMVNAVLANFLSLGTNGNGGAYALGTDLSDFFLASIQHYADLICGVINRQLIPNLVKLNYGPQAAYPQIKCTGISDKAGKELSEIIKSFVDSNVIKADDKLEEFIRDQYDLPAADPTTARAAPKASPAPFGNPKLSETKIQLDEKYRKQFNDKKAKLKELMQSNLRAILDGLKSQIRTKWNQSTPANRIKIATQLEASGVIAYKQDLKELLAQYANYGLDLARRQVPSKKNVKLAESIQLAAPRGGYFDALPPKVKKQVETSASVIADTQASDLEKVVTFQYINSASQESIDAILNDVETSAGPMIEGSTKAGMSVDAAASNAVANTINQASLEWFFDPEVLDGIESFTFTNEDPVSEICQSLAGTTWAVGDPNIDAYSPPLHHNCKSRLVANEKGDSQNPEIDSGGVPLTQKALDSITLCEANYHLCNVKKFTHS